MKRLLVALWIAGAVLYTLNTLFIAGWLSPDTQKTAVAADQAGSGKAGAPTSLTGPAVADSGPVNGGSVHDAGGQAPQATADVDRNDAGATGSPKPVQQAAKVDAAAAPASPNGAAADAQPNGSAAASTAAAPAAPAGSPGQQASTADAEQHVDQWVQVTRKDALVRSGPSASAPTILAYPVGRKLRVVGRQGDFAEVEDGLSGQIGWMDNESLGLGRGSSTEISHAGGTSQDGGGKAPSSSGAAVALNHAANLRSGASPGAATLRSYPAGTQLREIGRERGWVQVSNPETGETGWIYEQFIDSPGTHAPGHDNPPQSRVSSSNGVQASAQPPQRRSREAFAARSRPAVSAPADPDGWQPPPAPDEEQDAASGMPWERAGPLRRMFGRD